MRSILHLESVLKQSERLVSYALTGTPETEERRYLEAVAADVCRIGRSGDWTFLAATILRSAASGTHLWHDTRAQARILNRALSSR